MTTETQFHHDIELPNGQPQFPKDAGKSPVLYNENVETIPKEARELFVLYSGFKPEDVLPHVLALLGHSHDDYLAVREGSAPSTTVHKPPSQILSDPNPKIYQRDHAFRLYSYACIGQMRFLNYSLCQLPFFAKVLQYLHSGATFMDAGCCFGQELRYLASRENVPSQQLYGFDLEPGFLDLSYELFRDQGTFHATFTVGDVLASPSSPQGGNLSKLDGKMDIVYMSSFPHLWGRDRQKKALRRLAGLMRNKPGSMMVGRQIGSLAAGEYPVPAGDGFSYRHNPGSMAALWKEIEQEVGACWEVESGMIYLEYIKDARNLSWGREDPGIAVVWFCATRK